MAKPKLELDKFFWVQEKAPMGNWVDRFGILELKDAKSQLAYCKKIDKGVSFRIIRRYAEVVVG